jgi:hypothetical protein
MDEKLILPLIVLDIDRKPQTPIFPRFFYSCSYNFQSRGCIDLEQSTFTRGNNCQYRALIAMEECSTSHFIFCITIWRVEMILDRLTFLLLAIDRCFQTYGTSRRAGVDIQICANPSSMLSKRVIWIHKKSLSIKNTHQSLSERWIRLCKYYCSG